MVVCSESLLLLGCSLTDGFLFLLQGPSYQRKIGAKAVEVLQRPKCTVPQVAGPYHYLIALQVGTIEGAVHCASQCIWSPL